MLNIWNNKSDSVLFKDYNTDIYDFDLDDYDTDMDDPGLDLIPPEEDDEAIHRLEMIARAELDESESKVENTFFSAFGVANHERLLEHMLFASVDKYKGILKDDEREIVKLCFSALIDSKDSVRFFGLYDSKDRLVTILRELFELSHNLIHFLYTHDSDIQNTLRPIFEKRDSAEISIAIKRYVCEEAAFKYPFSDREIWELSEHDRTKVIKHSGLRFDRSVNENLIDYFNINEKLEESPAQRLEKFFNEYKPHRIVEYLDQRMVGQTEAKFAAAYILYSHVAMILHPELAKINAMFIGNSGTGKTFIWRILKEISPVPIFIRDASQLTPAGYQGDDAVEIVKSLSAPSNRDTGFILIWDETDKAMRPIHDSAGTNSSVSTQASLLKILEDGEMKSRYHTVDCSKITMVMLGVFEGVVEKASKRVGFLQQGYCNNSSLIQNLVNFGALPEILGRISIFATMDPLSDEDYMKMINFESGPLRRLKNRFEITDGISLDLEDQAKRELVRYAQESGTGARGIEALLTSVSIKAFNQSQIKGSNSIVLTKDDIVKGYTLNNC